MVFVTIEIEHYTRYADNEKRCTYQSMLYFCVTTNATGCAIV